MYGILYSAACIFDGQLGRLVKKLQVSVAWHHAGESSIDSASHKEPSSPSTPPDRPPISCCEPAHRSPFSFLISFTLVLRLSLILCYGVLVLAYPLHILSTSFAPCPAIDLEFVSRLVGWRRSVDLLCFFPGVLYCPWVNITSLHKTPWGSCALFPNSCAWTPYKC